MSVTGSSNAVAMPAAAAAAAPTDMTAIIATLQQLVTSLGALVQTLQAQAGTGAQAGAANLTGGGAGDATGGGAPSQTGAAAPAGASGCCGGASGAASGVGQLAEQGGGANGAPAADVSDAKAKSRSPKAGGANGAPTSSSAVAAPSDANASKGQKIVDFAKAQLGKSYVYGAAGPDHFDCSGLTMKALETIGVHLPHQASQQAKLGTAVDKKDLQPGDLLFFSNPADGVHHTGIYIGDGKMIHAPQTGDVVKVSDINTPYYQKEFYGARRFT